MQELYKKIAAAKLEIGAISKDSTNPFFKSKYFDINALLMHVEPILHRHGLMVLQPIINGEVFSIIVDDAGNTIQSGLKLSDNKDPQKLGSEITYFRRYTLQSLLSLQAEDDDANKASNKGAVSKPKLSSEGYAYLIEKGSADDIKKALNEREMTTEQRTQLQNKI
jgi:hypothetical protein